MYHIGKTKREVVDIVKRTVKENEGKDLEKFNGEG